MKTRLTLVAVCDKKREYLDLGLATDGGPMEAALARVWVYTVYWGRWMGERTRVVAETTPCVSEYDDVTDEACAAYVSKNGDAGAGDALKERRAMPKKILDAEWEDA